MIIRLFSVYDQGVHAYLRPFWSDHKTNAIRTCEQAVNETQNKENMVAQHPEQFILYELAVFNPQNGKLEPHSDPISVIPLIELKKS